MAMQLDRFFQGDMLARPKTAIQELLRAILVRTNFVPVVRHILGWRGLKQAVGAMECWTARIDEWDGVYGICFENLDNVPGWVRGRFALFYFPHPDEALVERCTLQAAASTQEEDYMRRVRDFPAFPEWADLFAIAKIYLAVGHEGKALGLTLGSMSRLRIFSEGGIRLPRDGTMVTLVAPGTWEQDFPAFQVASSFYDVLAASTTFNLDQPPCYLGVQHRPGLQMVRGRAGTLRQVPAADLCHSSLVLGYGQGQFEAIDPSCIATRAGCHWVAGQAVPEPYKDRLWWRAHQVQGTNTLDKKTLGVDERPPLVLLTGFLGAGKTTFLRHFLEYQTQRTRFVAVIQNEIGAVGLDGKLLDYTVTEIDEGCVCCSLAGNLKRAVQGILSSFAPDVILLETTGLANPYNLLDEMDELDPLVRFDCTLTVVDAANAQATLAAHPLATDQIRAADLIMLNKADLVPAQQLDDLTAQLRQINPRAPVFPTVNGNLNPALLLQPAKRPRPTRADHRPADRHPVHQQEDVWVKTLALPRPLKRKAFLQAVAQLPPTIFRMKGILRFTQAPEPMQFQYVGGRHTLSPFPEGPAEEPFLVIIGYGPKDPATARALATLGG
jgi:G3E family GTPase